MAKQLVICPTCGTHFYIADSEIELTDRQQKVYEAVGAASRNNGSASTKAVAGLVGWSVSTVWRELVYLEQIGSVKRPDGPRSGWARVVRHGIKLQKAAGF